MPQSSAGDCGPERPAGHFTALAGPLVSADDEHPLFISPLGIEAPWNAGRLGPAFDAVFVGFGN